MLKHLDCLGDANRAKTERLIKLTAFPRPRAAYGE